nr:Phosphorylated adapter RNA export protein domain containing protein [Haemonchus contortus]
MDYRRKEQDSDSSGNEDDSLPLDTHEIEEEEDQGPAAKRAANLWGDALVEQSLEKKGSRISLDKKNNDGRVARGVESYHIPSTFVRVAKEDFESYSKSAESSAKAQIDDDLFGDAPIDLDCETAYCERLSDSINTSRNRDTVHSTLRRGGQPLSHPTTSRGRGPRGRARGSVQYGFPGRGRGNGLKRSWQGKVSDPGQLLTASYSLETLMAVEFASDISVEQLGDEIAKAMGERDPRTVKSIVRACGVEKAITLFEETRKVESTGGMMIENGQRRRTPGGVFISLFKLDPDVPEDVKKQVFTETKRETRKMLRARKKGRNNFANDIAKLAELMKMEKEKSTEKNEMGEASSLKPLPSVEEVAFQKKTPEAMTVECDMDEIIDEEMQS